MKKTFLHLSDTHFLRQYPRGQEGYLALFDSITPVTRQLDACFRLVDISSLDFVLHTGDITEGGSAGDYLALKQYFDDRLGGLPLVVTLGNHDCKPGFYEGWLGQAASQEPYNTVKDVGGLRIISLDNAKTGSPDGELSAESLGWLKQILDADPHTPSILITHHHLLASQSRLPSAGGSDQLGRLLAGSQLLGVFCGHTHHNYTGWFAGKPYFTADSLSFVGESEDGMIYFEERSSVALFTLEDGHFSVQRLPLLPKARLLASLDLQVLQASSKQVVLPGSAFTDFEPRP